MHEQDNIEGIFIDDSIELHNVPVLSLTLIPLMLITSRLNEIRYGPRIYVLAHESEWPLDAFE